MQMIGIRRTNRRGNPRKYNNPRRITDRNRSYHCQFHGWPTYTPTWIHASTPPPRFYRTSTPSFSTRMGLSILGLSLAYRAAASDSGSSESSTLRGPIFLRCAGRGVFMRILYDQDIELCRCDSCVIRGESPVFLSADTIRGKEIQY